MPARVLRQAVACCLVALAPALPALGQDEGTELNQSISMKAITVDDGWGVLLRGPNSIFYDNAVDEIFVTDPGNNRVLIYDRNLSPRYSFTHFVRERTSGRTVKGEPRDLAVNSRGEIIIIDNYVDYLDVVDFRGSFLERIHLDELIKDTTLTIKPQRLAVDREDNLYIATSGDMVAVFVLDAYFELSHIIEGKQAGGSNFNTILTVAVQDSIVYVTDLYAEPAVKLFTTDGRYLSGFGAHDVERTDMSFPSGATILPYKGEPTIWIVDGLRQVVKVFHPDGRFLAHVGGFGYRPGEFRYPADIVHIGDSLFYVVERVGNRVQAFKID